MSGPQLTPKGSSDPLPPPTAHITANDPVTLKATFYSSEPSSWDMAKPDAFQMATTYTTNNTSLSTSGLVDTADLDLHHALLADPTSQSPPLGLVNPLGSVCRIVDTAPGYITPMHRTISVDYGVVIVGEMELQLDGGEKRILKAGDMVVQRGTMHAWRNLDDKQWSRMMFVMIGLGDGGAVNVGGRMLMEEFVEEAGDHSGGGAASSK